MTLPKTLVVAAARVPVFDGSTGMNRDLLEVYPQDRLAYCTPRPTDGKVDGEARHFVAPSTVLGLKRLPGKLEPLWGPLLESAHAKAVVKVIDEFKPELILAAYPGYYDLAAAVAAAKARSLPISAYLHDTVAEGLSSKPIAKKAASLQREVFSMSAPLFVANQAMADLYERKYGLTAIPLQAIYSEPIPDELPKVDPSPVAFWSGAVYSINQHAVNRLMQGVQLAGMTLRMTRKPNPRMFAQMDAPENLEVVFYPTRADILKALPTMGVHLAGLDAPDEAVVHPDELSTIFSTKSPEYLASGRPILIHCPEHYYMARFFRERECGLVVSEKDPAAIAEGLKKLMAGGPEIERMRRNGLEAARFFNRERIHGSFLSAMKAQFQDSKSR